MIGKEYAETVAIIATQLMGQRERSWMYSYPEYVDRAIRNAIEILEESLKQLENKGENNVTD